jgi:hypothetical protein
MYSINLAWKSYPVDLPSIEAFVKSVAGSSYKGNSADTDLTLWFSDDPTIVPETPETETQSVAAVAASRSILGVTVTANTAGAAGNVSLQADGSETIAELIAAWNTANPSNQLTAGAGDKTQVPAAGSLALSGGADATTQQVTVEVPGQSVATQVLAKWDGLASTSPEATAYVTNAQIAVVAKQVAAINAFCANLLVQFNTENLIMGISTDGKTDDVLTVMSSVLVALQSGSPTSAIKRAKEISPSSYDSKYVTAARLLSYCNKIETYLGITLSTSMS